MILNVRESKLNNVKLTYNELRFLMALLDNHLTNSKRIFKFIYGYIPKNEEKIIANLSIIKNRITKKTGIKILTRNNLGYILTDIVEVE